MGIIDGNAQLGSAVARPFQQALGRLATFSTAHSAVRARMQYLQRPDLGRTLNTDSRLNLLQHHQQQQPMQRPYDLALVIADGLSAQAITQNAVPFLRALQAELAQGGQESPTLAPTVIVQQGRVAIGDKIGEIWQARAVLVLIGERPGLSSPASMGLY